MPLQTTTATTAVHSPIEAPARYVQPYAHLDPTRVVFAGMLAELDAAVGLVRRAWERAGMWDNTFTVFTTDNGGPIHECAGIGASNFPLRGGKCSVLEGGTKGTALLYSALLRVSSSYFTKRRLR